MPGPGGPGPRGCLIRGGTWSWGVPGPGVMPGPRGVPGLGGVPGGDPPGQLLLRAVRTLLECILVYTVA